MQTRWLFCFCVLGIVSALDDRSLRQVHISLSQNATTNEEPEVSVLPNKSQVFTNDIKSLSKSFTETSARQNLISKPIVVINEDISDISDEDKDNEIIPVPVIFASNDTTSTVQSQTSNSVQIVEPNNALPVPVLVKTPLNPFYPVASTPGPFVPSPVEPSPPTSENELENPFADVSSTFRLWPKLPEPVPVPVLAHKSFAKILNEKSKAYVGPQYHRKEFNPVTPAPNVFQPNSVPLQYPVNFQTLPQQSGQAGNLGPTYLITPGANNNVQPNFGAPAPSQASFPSQAQTGNQNGNLLNFGANSQPSVPYQAIPGLQPFSNYAVQAQVGQQAPLNYKILGPSNATGSQLADQQAALKYSIFGPTSAPFQTYVGGQIPSLGYSGFTSQNGNYANPLGLSNFVNSLSHTPAQPRQPISPSTAAPTAPPNFYQPTSSPQYFGVSSTSVPTAQPAYYQPTLSQTPAPPRQPISPSTAAPTAQPNFYQPTSSSQYFGVSSTSAPTAQPAYYQPTLSQTPAPPRQPISPSIAAPATTAQLARFQLTSSPQYSGVSSTAAPTAQPAYYQPTSSPQYFSVSPTLAPTAQPNYYQPTSSPQYSGVSSTLAPTAQPNYYQPTASPQYFGFSSTLAPTAQPNNYQPISSSQYSGVSSTLAPTAQPNYYQPTSSPQYSRISSSLAPTAQPNYYQPSPQYSGVSSTLAPTAQPNYYQPTSSPQYFGVSSSSAPTAQPNFYQSVSPSQFPGFPIFSSPTAQPTASPQFTGFSSTPGPTAQPNYFQSLSGPQYSLAPDAQQQYYQQTSLAQNFGFPPASPGYQFSEPTSQVRFSSNRGSYSYFIKK